MLTTLAAIFALLPFGFGQRSRRGHAATASDSYYFGARRSAAAGFNRSAVAAGALTRRDTARICEMTMVGAAANAALIRNP